MEPVETFPKKLELLKQSLKDDDIKGSFVHFIQLFSSLKSVSYLERKEDIHILLEILKKIIVAVQNCSERKIEELYNYSQHFTEIVPRIFLTSAVATAAIYREVDSFENITRDLSQMAYGVRNVEFGILLHRFFLQNIKTYIIHHLTSSSANQLQYSINEDEKDEHLNANHADFKTKKLHSEDGLREDDYLKQELKITFITFLMKSFVEMNTLWVLYPRNVAYMSDYCSNVKKVSLEDRQELLKSVNYPMFILSSIPMERVQYKKMVFDILVGHIIHCNDSLSQSNMFNIMLKLFPFEYNISLLEELFTSICKITKGIELKSMLKIFFDNLCKILMNLYINDKNLLKEKMNWIFSLIEKCASSNDILGLFLNNCYVEMYLKAFPNDIRQIDIYLKSISNSLNHIKNYKYENDSAKLSSNIDIINKEIEEFLGTFLNTNEIIEVITIPGFIDLFKILKNKDSFVILVSKSLANHSLNNINFSDKNNVNQLINTQFCAYDEFSIFIESYIIPFLNKKGGRSINSVAEPDIINFNKQDIKITFEDRIKISYQILSYLNGYTPEDNFAFIELTIKTFSDLKHMFSYKLVISNLLYKIVDLFDSKTFNSDTDTNEKNKLKEGKNSFFKKISSYLMLTISTISTPDLASESMNLLMSCCNKIDKIEFSSKQEVLYDLYTQIFSIYEEDILDNQSQISYLEQIIDHLKLITTLEIQKMIFFQTKSIHLSMRLLKKSDQCSMLLKLCHILLPNVVHSEESNVKQFTISEILNKSLKITNTIIDDDIKADSLIKILKSFVNFYSDDENSTGNINTIKSLFSSIEKVSQDLLSQNQLEILEQLDLIKSDIETNIPSLWNKMQIT